MDTSANQLTKNAKPEINCHHDDIAITGKYWTIIGISRIPFVRLSMNENDDGKLDIHVFSTN